MKLHNAYGTLLAVLLTSTSTLVYAQDNNATAAQIDATPPAMEGPITTDQLQPIGSKQLPQGIMPPVAPPAGAVSAPGTQNAPSAPATAAPVTNAPPGTPTP